MLITTQHNRGHVATAAAPRAHVGSPAVSYAAVAMPAVCMTPWHATTVTTALVSEARIRLNGHKFGARRLEERST